MTATAGSMETTFGTRSIGGCRTAVNGQVEKPHLDMALWLKTLQLYEQYGRLFEKFSGVEDIIEYSGRELVELGVKNASHRATLQSGLAVLRDKYKNAVMRKNSSTVTSALVAFYENGAAKGNNDSNSRNVMDGNMNRIEQHQPTPNMVVNSDEENYINHRLHNSATSLSPRKFSLNVVNNNEDGTAADADNIRGHLWYHGAIGRSQAEALVSSGQPEVESGLFLVRDCISRAGNYVLTCKWHGSILHFMINRTVLNTSANSVYEKIVYHFEDDHYQSVPDLIRAYVGQKKPVTEESQCIISKPVNRSSNSATLRHTVSEKSVLYPEERRLRIVDEDREQGNYVRMRENKPQQATTAQRGSISANGIANLKIPQVPESIRNRPLPPVPRQETASACKALTLRNRVMLKEARRHQLNKWRSESALENPAHNSSLTIASSETVINDENLLHASTSLQSLNKDGDNGKSNNRLESIQDTLAPVAAPAKPRRAPSLKNGQKPMLVIRDTETGQFREIEETELDGDDLDEEDDYHEYCDIDYDQLPDPVPRSRVPADLKASPVEEFQAVKTPPMKEDLKKAVAKEKDHSTPPALPPRPKPGTTIPFLGVDRDSACVPDMVMYDRPNELCKPYSPRIAPQATADHYDVIRSAPIASIPSNSRVKLETFRSPILPFDVKPLDNRVWPKIRDLLLTQDAQILALAATKADLTYLNLLDDEKLLDFVSNHALTSLILLPNGDQFRMDVMERSTCWKFFVASTLLQNEPEDTRVRILSKWVDTARMVKEKFGNEFAFSNIMTALVSPEISSLSSLWRQLQLDYPSQADTFSSFLRPEFYAMQRFQNGPDTPRSCGDLCVPDLDPLVRLYGAVSIDELRLYDWEEENADEDTYGLESFWQRLQSARQWPTKINQWRLNFYSHLHSMIEDNDCARAEAIFQTEFHLRYLFGTRGSSAAANERSATFQRILAAMAMKIQHT